MSVGSTKSSSSSASSASRSSSSSAGVSRSAPPSPKTGTPAPKTGTPAAKGRPVDRFETANPKAAKGNAPVKQLRNGTAGAGTSNMDVDKAVTHLDANAHGKSQKQCAQYVRKAIEAGGVKLDVNTRPGSAKDYGPYLKQHGFTAVDTQNYVPQKGDVVVIQPYEGGSAAGHIAMYNGSQWVSDFRQTDMWSGPGYRKNQPPYEIYRP